MILAIVFGILLVVETARHGLDHRASQKRVDDLLNRLASRTYAEYAAFQPQHMQAPIPERRIITDDTGLIEIDDVDE